VYRHRVIIIWILSAWIFTVGRAEGGVTLGYSLSVSEIYNDNLFFTETDRETDTVTMITPRLSLSLTSKPVNLTVGYAGSAEFYARHSAENRYTQSATMELDLPALSRQVRGVEVSVTEEVSFTPELPAFTFGGEDPEAAAAAEGTPLPEIAQPVEEGVQTERSDTFRNRAGLALVYAGIPRYRTTLGYEHTITRYEATDLADTTTHSARVEEGFQSSARTQWTAEYRYSVTIPDEIAAAPEEEDATTIHRVEVGGDHQITPTLTGGESVGAAWAEGEPPHTTVGARLLKRFRTGSLSLGYTSDVRGPGGLIPDTSLQQSVTTRGVKTVGPYSAVFLNFGYSKIRALSGEPLTVATYVAGAGVTVRLLSYLQGSLRYSFTQQEAQGAVSGDGERNQVAVVFTATGRPWRAAQ
jgi:hypothetical protein